MSIEGIKVIAVALIIWIGLVIGSYALFVGLLGNNYFSTLPADWESFANYFNSMLSPFLASLAAILAFFSLKTQIEKGNREVSLKEESSTCLRQIEIAQGMIDSRWRAIMESRRDQKDWEFWTYGAINKDNIKDTFKTEIRINQDVMILCELFMEISEALEWYVAVNKKLIDADFVQYERAEWTRFPKAVRRLQDKKMKFCYEYLLWVEEERGPENEMSVKGYVFKSFYEGLASEVTG